MKLSDLNKKQETSSFISEIGDVYKDTIWKSIFLDKTFDDIDSFIKTIPTKSPNPFIQEMIFDFLTTKKKLNNKNISNAIDLFIKNLKSFKSDINSKNNKSIINKLIKTKKVRTKIIKLKQDINKPDFGRS